MQHRPYLELMPAALALRSAARTGAPIGFAEFVALVAAMMAMVALRIDSMLPALPAIGEALGVDAENRRQLVISAFTLGFGIGQLVHGPLCDRFGRRRMILASLGAYGIINLLCAGAGSFPLLLVARVAGGVAVAATRVATTAMVRDCYDGRSMARVMSVAFMVFMIVPVVAPAYGSLVLLLGEWRLIFTSVAVLAAMLAAWFALRMPETLHVGDRAPLDWARVSTGWRLTASDRWSLGYTLAATALMGALYGYLNTIQQIMAETFGRPNELLLVFGIAAGVMAAANLANAALVLRLGTRRISHGALIALIAVSLVHLTLAMRGGEPLWAFVLAQALTMGCFGLASANFSAMAMQNMGHIAGTAASVQGFASVTLGTLIGVGIGQAFDGTPRAMVAGFLASGVVALGIVTVAERGRLFQPAS